MRRLLYGQSSSITGAALLLGAASFVSRLIGIFRDRLFTHLFGAGDVLDAYYAAFRIPDFVYNLLLVGALSAGFIPIFTTVLLRDKKEAWRVCNMVLHLVAAALLFTCAILFAAARPLVSLLTPGFSGDKLETTILLTRIMLASPLILGVSSVVSSAIQSFKQFFVYAITPIVYNIGIMIGAVVLVPVMGLAGLGLGVIIGALFHLGIQLPALLRQGYRYQPLWSLQSQPVREIIRLVIPRAFGLGAQQFNLVVITALASTLTVGSVAAFNLANHLQSFPIGIIGVSFGIAAFPTLAKFAAEKNTSEFITHISGSVRAILFMIIPATILFLLLRAQIVRVLFGSGAFDWEDTIMTADTLAFFSLSLFAQALIPLLGRALYAIKDTWTPFLISLFTVIINAALAQLFTHYRVFGGVPGLAFAFSVSMVLQCVLLWVWLRHRVGNLDELRILKNLYKMSVAGLLMAPMVQWLKTPIAELVDMTRFWGVCTQAAVAGLGGMTIYLAACYLLRVEELTVLVQSLKRRWLKLRQPYVDFSEHD